jgi:SAM-dependent methyltransferase
MILLYIILIICLFSIAAASLSLAPWVPTHGKDLKRTLDLAQLKRGETFYDLGCGNGKVPIYIARHSQANTIGIELALPLYFICKLRQLFIRRPNLKFKFKNLYKENLNDAQVVYIFADSADKLKGKIKIKLEKELRPGSRVITYAFPVSGWQPVKISKPRETDMSIYLYEIK